MSIILYTTGCPKCRILKKKLEEKNIEYEICNDIDAMLEKGFVTAPVLEVNSEVMDFKTAVDFVNKLNQEDKILEINIKLNKNFTTQYNQLQEEFGTEIALINGFDDGQLSYTDFVYNFVDESTVADASIDGNSNVSHKDIVTLEK